MQTECSAERSMFGRVEGRSVVAEFDGDALTSDAARPLVAATGAAQAPETRTRRRPANKENGRRRNDGGGQEKDGPVAPHRPAYKPTARNLSTPQRLAGLDHVANRAVDPPRRRRRQKRGLAGQKSAPGLAQGEP